MRISDWSSDVCSSDLIHYDSKSGTASMTGGAHIKRGDDEVDGDTIGYIVQERRIQAASGGKGQVTIIFQPPPAKKQDAPSGKKNRSEKRRVGKGGRGRGRSRRST